VKRPRFRGKKRRFPRPGAPGLAWRRAAGPAAGQPAAPL